MSDFKLKITDGISKISKKIYESIWSSSPFPTPFTKWEFLCAMEETRCVGDHTGWIPRPFQLINHNDEVYGIIPNYVKLHSYGEYVFDWAWASAYQQIGLNYYPKWTIASPYSPVPGTKVLLKDQNLLKNFMDLLTSTAMREKISSIHLLFPMQNEINTAKKLNWLVRYGVQFHWENKQYENFDDYLKKLSQSKRKKIKAERKKVVNSGVFCKVLRGNEISKSNWEFFYKCYERTYLEHGNPPYLSLEFFLYVSNIMVESFIMVIAYKKSTNQPIASSLIMIGEEKNKKILYGRYWGALERVSCLHFELAYYSVIEWAIENKIDRYEGGAQGEHKLARGFEAKKTYSAHWISDERFKNAVANFLSRESNGIDYYISELTERNPFKKFS